jgi:hypothetical protein
MARLGLAYSGLAWPGPRPEAGPKTALEKELWSSDEFVRNNAYKWIGPEAESSEEYEEVDRGRSGREVKREDRSR